MKFAFEIQHRPGQSHMAAGALPRLSTTQLGDSNVTKNIPAYENNDAHAVINSTAEEEVELFTKASFLLE